VQDVFEMVVPVLPADIDGQNHVNNTVYLRWIQDVATAHWRRIAPADAQETVGWVVLRHEIDYKAPANLGDEILLRTWVGKATRLTFERFTEIRRKADNGAGGRQATSTGKPARVDEPGGESINQLLSQARTVWCPINSATGRPMRVSNDVRAQFSVE
jgi:acyl-CoA thioester hydrolase